VHIGLILTLGTWKSENIHPCVSTTWEVSVMKGSRYSDEKIAQILAESEYSNVTHKLKICRKYSISKSIFDRWRHKFKGMSSTEAKRLEVYKIDDNHLDNLRRDEFRCRIGRFYKMVAFCLLCENNPFSKKLFLRKGDLLTFFLI